MPFKPHHLTRPVAVNPINMRSKKGYIDSTVDYSAAAIDLTHHGSSSLTKVHFFPVKAQKPTSKIVPESCGPVSPAPKTGGVMLKLRAGKLVFSKAMKRLSLLATSLLSVGVIISFTLDRKLPYSFDHAAPALLTLSGFFTIRQWLCIIAIGLRTVNWTTILELMLAFSAFLCTLIALKADSLALDSITFQSISRLFAILLAFRLVFNYSSQRRDPKKRLPGHSLRVEVVGDKAQEVLRRVLSEPWLQHNAELSADVQWCLDAIAEDRLHHTIVRVSSESDDSGIERELLEIVNRFSALDSKESVVLKRKTTEYQISGLSSPSPNPELTAEVTSCLRQVDSVNFDPFALQEATAGRELFVLLTLLCNRRSLLNTVGVGEARFAAYVGAIQAGYNTEVKYHNATHATDVTQMLHYLLVPCGAAETAGLNAVEMFAAYLAALVHDFQHPGLTNSFLVATQNELALTYNDRSVLQNHHISAAFAVAQSRECDVFSDLSQENFSHLRTVMISMVLATDSSHHFSLLSHFKAKFSGDLRAKEGRQLVLETILHAADIGSPARPWDTCHRWAELILEEMWLQGDRETSLGLPLSYLTDRRNANVPKSQISFVEVIVEPLYAVVRDAFPQVEDCYEHIRDNLGKWKEQIIGFTDLTCVREPSFRN